MAETVCNCNAGWTYYPKGGGPDPARCPVHGTPTHPAEQPERGES